MRDTQRTFTRKELLEEYDVLDDPISDEIIDHSRWTVIHSLLFRLPDQPENEAWRVAYSVGATEQQDEGPWEYEEEIKARLVERRQVTKMEWVLVE